MSRFEALLFDLDGTLVDSRADLSDAVNHALKAVGKPTQPEAVIVKLVGNGLRRLMSDAVGPSSDAVLDQAVEAFNFYYDRHYADKTTMYEGVADGLLALSKQMKIGVVSNKPERFSKLLLKALKVDAFFSVIIGGDTTSETKPHPAPLLKAIKDMNIGGNVLMIGDGPQDIKAGKAANVKTCAVKYGYGFSEETAKLNPDFLINQFSELKEIVS